MFCDRCARKLEHYVGGHLGGLIEVRAERLAEDIAERRLDGAEERFAERIDFLVEERVAAILADR